MDSERRCRLASEALTPLAIRAGQILPRIPPPETLLGLAPSHGGSGGIDSRGGGARTLSTSGEQQPTNTPLSGRNGATRTSNHSSSHQPVQHPQPAQAPTTPSVEGSVPVRLTSESRPENGKRPRSPIATQSSMEMTNWIIERMTKVSSHPFPFNFTHCSLSVFFSNECTLVITEFKAGAVLTMYFLSLPVRSLFSSA